MREERLLERIRACAKEPNRRERGAPGRIIDSILQHLQRVLNTKRGNVPISETFGIPDYSELLHAYPDSLKEFERAVRQTIQQYEPRLKAVRVNFLPREENSLVLRFEILARLAGEDENLPVRFESIWGPEREIKVIK